MPPDILSSKEYKAAILALGQRFAHRVPQALQSTWQEGDWVRWPKELIAPLQANAFHYSPLPRSSCIRLLRIKPGKASEMVDCSLFTVDLDENPQYAALSYSWKRDEHWTPSVTDVFRAALASAKEKFWDRPKLKYGWSEFDIGKDESFGLYLMLEKERESEHMKTIMCDGKRMEVYPNLYEALLQLRQSHPGDYWIDAICINQEDTRERGTQIQMMDQIYKSAEIVRVWLGTSPALLSESIVELQSARLRPGVDKPGELPEFALSALYLLSRRWFRRLWVLQETCLAKEIMFQLGKHELQPSTLVKVIEWISGSYGYGGYNDVFSDMIAVFGVYLTYVPAILKAREEFKQGEQWSLAQWVRMTKGRKATQANDFVYAGLGLIQEQSLLIKTDLLLPGLGDESVSSNLELLSAKEPSIHSSKQEPLTTRKLWPALRADIDAKTPEVFLNLAACLLSQPRPMDLLSVSARFRVPEGGERLVADFRLGLENWPSWIPSPMSRLSTVLNTIADLEGNHFATSTSLTSDTKISADGRTLYLDAMQLDTVERIRCSSNNYTIADVMKLGLELPMTYAPTACPSLEAIAHVLIAGIWEDANPIPEEALRAFLLCTSIKVGEETKSWVTKKKEQQQAISQSALHSSDKKKKEQKLLENQREIEELEILYQSLRSRFSDLPWPTLRQEFKQLSAEDKKLVYKYENTIPITMNWRTLFITKRGFLGLGPSFMREGDVVMIVKGAHVPYIFTQVDLDLKRGITAIQEKLQDPGTLRGVAQLLERKLKELEKKVGRQDAWILTGEAYVEGIMSGEAAESGEYGRIAIV